MDYVERDRLKLALDIYTIATSEREWSRAVKQIAEVLDELKADVRKRAADVCEYVAIEWLDHQSMFTDPAAAATCRQLRAEAAESAMLCASRIDPAGNRDRREQIVRYLKGEKVIP